MSVTNIYQQPRLKSLLTKISDDPFCYFFVGLENGTTLGFEFALPYFTTAKEYAEHVKINELDNFLESLVTSLPGGLFVTGILINDKVEEKVADDIFNKLSKLGPKLKFGSSVMAKVCVGNSSSEKTIVLSNGSKYTYDDGEKLVAVPIKQYKAIFVLYKINITVTAKSQKITDIADSVKNYKFFEENEDDDSALQRNLFYTLNPASNSNQKICIKYSGNIPIFYPYLLSSDFKQNAFVDGVTRALTSTSDDMVAVSVASKDINDVLPPLVFYTVKENSTETIRDCYYLLTKNELKNVKIRMINGKVDMDKLKSKVTKETVPNMKAENNGTTISIQTYVVASAAAAVFAVIFAYYLL